MNKPKRNPEHPLVWPFPYINGEKFVPAKTKVNAYIPQEFKPVEPEPAPF